MELCALIVDPLLDGDIALARLVLAHGDLPPGPSTLDDAGRWSVLFARPPQFTPVDVDQGLKLVEAAVVAEAPPLPPWLRAPVATDIIEREVRSGLIGRAFAEAGLVIRYLGSCGMVTCPFEAEHFGVVFGPRTGSAMGWFDCRRCRACGRKKAMAEVLGALPADAVERARAALGVAVVEVAAPTPPPPGKLSQDDALRVVFDWLPKLQRVEEGITARALILALYGAKPLLPEHDEMRAAVASLMDLPLGQAPGQNALSFALGRMLQRVIGGRMLERSSTNHGTALWRVGEVKVHKLRKKAT